jgi:hypothetical protein
VLVAVTRDRAARMRDVLFAFAAGVVLPVVACVALLATRMPFALALRGAAGNWIHLRGDILDYQFYRAGMGLDDPSGNLIRALTVFAAMVAVVALAVAAAFATRRLQRWRLPVAVLAGTAFAAALLAAGRDIAWIQVGRPLPLTTALALVWLVSRVVAARHAPASADLVTPTMWAAFALLLLGKVVLDVRISHYGFVLALPATLLLIATLVHSIPAALDARGANGAMARAILVAPIVAATVYFVAWSNRTYVHKNTVVGHGSDAFLETDEDISMRAHDVNLAAERLHAMMPPGATLMAIPDGLMLNYWLRSPNPTRHIYFVPWSLAFANGEAAVLAEIQQHPPDFIAIVHRKAEEYGFTFFGADERFGASIMRWVRANYRRVQLIGLEPLTGRGFGILLMSYEPPAPGGHGS